jgi:hypothetical protein
LACCFDWGKDFPELIGLPLFQAGSIADFHRFRGRNFAKKQANKNQKYKFYVVEK